MDPVVQEQKKEEPNADKPAPKTVVVYHVQLGYFDQFDLAEKEAEDLKKRGIDCSVEVKGTGYYIQGGAYNFKDNAKKAVKDLASRKVIKKKGIKPFYFSTKEKI